MQAPLPHFGAVLYSGTQNLHYFLYFIIVGLQFMLLCLLQYDNSSGMIDTYCALEMTNQENLHPLKIVANQELNNCNE